MALYQEWAERLKPHMEAAVRGPRRGIQKSCSRDGAIRGSLGTIDELCAEIGRASRREAGPRTSRWRRHPPRNDRLGAPAVTGAHPLADTFMVFRIQLFSLFFRDRHEPMAIGSRTWRWRTVYFRGRARGGVDVGETDGDKIRAKRGAHGRRESPERAGGAAHGGSGDGGSAIGQCAAMRALSGRTGAAAG